MSRYAPGYTGPTTTAASNKPKGPRVTPVKVKPKPGTPGVKVFDDSGMGIKKPSGYTNPVPTTDKTGKPLKGMAKGGMAKKGYAKGGMANCGASMKPAQKSSK